MLTYADVTCNVLSLILHRPVSPSPTSCHKSVIERERESERASERQRQSERETETETETEREKEREKERERKREILILHRPCPRHRKLLS
jgi:hypothetical protein